jgi:TonB family protein
VDALVERAREASEIRSDENGPFRLRARVRVWDEAGAETEGVYQEIWRASDEWRQEISFQGFHQIFVRKNARAWRQGNMDYRPYRVFQFVQTLRFPYYLRLRPGEKAEKIEEVEAAGARLTCAALKTTIVPDVQTLARFDRRLCFEIPRGILLRQEYSNAVWEYADYAPLGGKLFPRILRYSENGRRVIEVVVEELKLETDPEATFLLPTPQAVIHDWCDSPDPPRILLQPRPHYPKEARRAGIGGLVRVYVVVGKDGKAHSPTVVQSPGPDFDRALLKSLPGWRFRPAMCRGKPTDAVTFVELEFKVY